MIDRIMGVLRLDVPTFETIEHDENATTEAAIIVGIVALISAVGNFFTARRAGAFLETFGSDIEGFGEIAQFASSAVSPIGSAISALIGAFVAWVVWSYLTYFIGTKMFEADATPQEMMRVLGYAMVPQVLSFIPCIGFLAWIYSLVLGFIGARQGLDLDNGKTAITIGLSFVAYLLVSFIIGLILTPIYALLG